MSKRSHVDDLRAAGRLAVEATKRVTELVEAMHREIASGPTLLGKPFSGPATVITRVVYSGITATTQAVGAAIDVALASLAPLLGESVPGDERQAVVAALNGVLGDYLHDSHNPLAIEMRLRVAITSRKLLVMVHGSSMSDRQWLRNGHDHGAALAAALGWGVAYLRYNSGLHISENGAQFAQLLGALDADEIIIIGHSMGGLVARSALAHLSRAPGFVRALICIATPHHGAPLERGGNWMHQLIGVSRYSAPIAQLARIRSAGITDLRYGNVQQSDWQGRDRFAPSADPRTPLPLPEALACFAIAATRSTDSSTQLRSDGLVPVESALGQHQDPALRLAFTDTATIFGVSHLGLLDSQPAYAVMRDWLLR